VADDEIAVDPDRGAEQHDDPADESGFGHVVFLVARSGF
jgi:hypothetical protein